MKNAPTVLTLPVGPRDHIIGNPDPLVTLVEYGDYQCPFCGQAHVVVSELIRQFGPELRYVFRHFPITTIHPHAGLAAEAAEAAGAQGKFWEMHNMLYTHQEALDPPSLTRYAGLLGLDLPRFTSELAQHVHAPRVREDFISGVRSGVNGTPCFFINGVRHDGAWDFETLAVAIAAASAPVPAA
ncbi:MULTISPECIES: DsbA family protein [Rhodomicrobium]|uniref:DsbA family protein n=1 Tax=Rhodomicrobium TaxID=1068 RepID=UPI000B4BEA0C|nr:MULTISPECIES: DsbA family protein [Rhodomicrobium]